MVIQNFRIDKPVLSAMITICETKKDNSLKVQKFGIKDLKDSVIDLVLVFIRSFLIQVEQDLRKVIRVGTKVREQLKSVKFVKRISILLDIVKEDFVQGYVYSNLSLGKVILDGNTAKEQKEKGFTILKNIELGVRQCLRETTGLAKIVAKEVFMSKHIILNNGVNIQN